MYSDYSSIEHWQKENKCDKTILHLMHIKKMLVNLSASLFCHFYIVGQCSRLFSSLLCFRTVNGPFLLEIKLYRNFSSSGSLHLFVGH